MAKSGNIYGSWTRFSGTADAELRTNLPVMRARGRDLARNSDYAKRFLRLLDQNVVGQHGIVLKPRSRMDSGELDKVANEQIGEAWNAWTKKGTCTADGRHSWEAVQSIILNSLARDGEILVRQIRRFDNGFDYALQLLEADHLDDLGTHELSNRKNIVYLGIERDRWDRPQNYHILSEHPGSDFVRVAGRTREIVPADEIIHVFLAERPTQSRGVPWLHSSGTRLQMLDGYEEAELIAARVGASKMGIWTEKEGNELEEMLEPELDEELPGQNEHDELIDQAAPGTFWRAPEGLKLETFDVDHPNASFGDYTKSVLRGIAAGLNVSYTSLAMDLEGVNFSSIRQGALDERDFYRCLQRFMIREVCEPIFFEWLRINLLNGTLSLPTRKIESFRTATWQVRGWPWVDPQKDAKAAAERVALAVDTRSNIAAEQGRDFDENLEELAEEQAKAKAAGVDLSKEEPAAPAPDPVDPAEVLEEINA